MKKSKKSFLTVMLLSALLGTMTTAYAAEPEKKEVKESSVKVDVYYSSTVAPQNNDTFEIKYQKTGTNKIEEIIVDASGTDKEQLFKVEPGDYTVTNIRYKGYNSDIEVSGYAVTGGFHVEKEGTGLLYLAIGEEEGRKLIENYANVLSVQNGEYVDGFSTEENYDVEPLELPDDIPEEPEKDQPEEQTSEEPTEKPTEKPAEEEKTEKPENETESKSEQEEVEATTMPGLTVKSILLRLAPVLVTAVGIGIFIYIMHKKGKI